MPWGSGDGGTLRTGVDVREGDEFISVSWAFWSTELPTRWVHGAPGLLPFLRRQVSVGGLSQSHPGLRGVLSLLVEQGCVGEPLTKPQYTLADVARIFKSIRLGWYGDYYGHPLWSELRDGRLPRAGLAAWLLHNYHVSRSAGMTDARGAIFSTTPDLRRRFATNAIDEYAHCDDFYFVRSSTIAISDTDVKAYVPLASNKAFDQQMLRLAQGNWLGHLLVSYFQESTASYLEDCLRFYREVGRHYDIGETLGQWQRHVEVDLAEQHAARLEHHFRDTELVERDQLVAALNGTFFCFRFLLEALDEIVAESSSSVADMHLRMPCRDGIAPASSLTRGVEITVPAGTEWTIVEIVLKSVVAPARQEGEVQPQAAPAAADLVFLAEETQSILYGALGFADEHDDILALGRLLERARGERPAVDPGVSSTPRSPWAMAIANYLRELAPRAELFIPAYYFASHLLQIDHIPCLGVAHDEVINVLRRRMEVSACAARTRDMLVTRLLQLGEIIRAWQARGATPPALDPEFQSD